MHWNLEYIIFWNSFTKLIWDDTSCDSQCKYIIPQATKIYLDIIKTFVKCEIYDDRINQQLIAYEKS